MNYTKLMQSKVKAALGDDFKGYQWASYPTDNYGVATTYIPDAPGEDPSASNFECDTFKCLGLQLPDDPQKRLGVGGFAATGTGAPITLSESEKSEIEASLILPKVAAALNIDADFKKTKGITTSLRIGPVTDRRLYRDKYQSVLEKLPPPSRLRTAYLNGSLVYVVADVVASSMEVSIKVDKTQNAALSVKLDDSTKIAQFVAKDSSFKFSIKGDGSGEYKVSIDRPIILATLARRQPSGSVLGAAGGSDGKSVVLKAVGLTSP